MASRISIPKVQTDSREVNQLQQNIHQAVVPKVNQLLESTSRQNIMAQSGIWVGSAAPATPITYAQWLSGAQGYWAWVTV